MNLTLYSVNGIFHFISTYTDNTAIFILDSDGNRILAKYYQAPHLPTNTPLVQSPYITTPQPNPYPTVKEQKKFEKDLFAKTKKQTSDVILFDNRLVVYKQTVDTTLYVVGGADENEIMLYLVVVALRDSLDALLKYLLPPLILVQWILIVDIRWIKDQYSRTTILSPYALTKFVMMGMPCVVYVANRSIILETDAANICSRITKPPTTDITNVKVDLTEQGLLNAYKSVRELARERNWL